VLFFAGVIFPSFFSHFVFARENTGNVNGTLRGGGRMAAFARSPLDSGEKVAKNESEVASRRSILTRAIYRLPLIE